MTNLFLKTTPEALDRKALPATRIEWKADEAGTFRAVFSTLNVIDHDGDVTRPGAFDDGGAVRISAWGHSSWSGFGGGNQLPVGKGVIHANDREAWVDGEFFLQTDHGKATYETVKALGDLQEWSYGFEITKASFGQHDGQDVRFLEGVKVHEVSPVMLGAGLETRTEAIKNLSKAAIASHSTETSGRRWDGPANEARLRTEESASYYRRAFAWRDEDGDAATKAAYRFIHHEVDGEGAVGAANLTACSSAIAVLNGGRGGTTIPDEDRRGVYNHLARHLRDGDREPPELRQAPGTLADHGDWVLADLAVFLERVKGLAALRASEGKALSDVNRERLDDLLAKVHDTAASIDALLKGGGAESDPNPEELQRLFLEGQRTLARLHDNIA